MRKLLDVQLDDDDAERVRRSHAEAIGELQSFPVLTVNVIRDVSLPNGAEVEIPHKLGRRFQSYSLSATRGAAASGRIGEVRGAHTSGLPIDPAKALCLQAVGYGATVLVDVTVW